MGIILLGLSVSLPTDSYPNQFPSFSGAVRHRNIDVLEDLRDGFRGAGRAQVPLEWRLPKSKELDNNILLIAQYLL